MIRTYTIEEQVRLLDSAYPRNYLRAAARINAKHRELHALMLRRVRGIGEEQYGDATFHKSKAELIVECDEELADALMYDALIELRESGVIS